MQLALLWASDKPDETLEELVTGAARRFRAKFGLGWPEFALVHPSMLATQDQGGVSVYILDENPGGTDSGLVRVMPNAYTQPGQVLIGLEGVNDD